jgi:hypothetical protein
MVKLVDMPDLGSGAARRVGSSPIIRTEKASEKSEAFLFLVLLHLLRLSFYIWLNKLLNYKTMHKKNFSF